MKKLVDAYRRVLDSDNSTKVVKAKATTEAMNASIADQIELPTGFGVEPDNEELAGHHLDNFLASFGALTEETASYPEVGTGSTVELAYLALGMVCEAGECGDILKKILRDGNHSEERNDQIVKEVGDILWYLTRLMHVCGISGSRIVQANIEKLTARKAAGTLHSR